MGGWLLLLLLSVCFAAPCTNRTTPTALTYGDYDFIVAGAGTAGCIVAARLVSAGFHVLVIESGYRLYDNPNLSSQLLVPVFTGTPWAGEVLGSVEKIFQNLQNMPFLLPYVPMTNAAHQYLTVPQIYAQKREVNYPRGNMIGGSSGANAMIYFRGSVQDFDRWENEYGLEGWGFDDVLPYFLKYENNEDVPNKTDIHGYNGPIQITITKNQYPPGAPPGNAWTQAALNIGYPKIIDASDPRTVYGASDSWQTFTNSSGRRSDSSVYIRILDQQGKVCWNKAKSLCAPGQLLSVWTETRVTKVLLNNTRAIGVEYATGVGLDRSDHPTLSRMTDEALKNHVPFNKLDKFQTQNPIIAPQGLRFGAPVARELAFNFNAPYEQYIPESATSYTPQSVTAKYEVIVSAGSVVTPQLLMLSGIGPKEHLRAKKIPLVQDLPVGTHTSDHQELFLTWTFPLTYQPPFNFLTEFLQGQPEFQKYEAGERSFYSSTEFVAGLDGSSAGPNGTVPTWHMHHLVGGAFENLDFNIAAYDSTVNIPYRVPRGILENLSWQGLRLHTHGCELSGNHAFGKIELRNKDPFVPPFVDPRWGSSDEDVAELVHCIKTMRQVLANTDPAYRGEEMKPSADAVTDQQLTQYVRSNVWGHHISSSAPMGTCDDEYAVTDGKGRVYGVDALRVVDISIFPSIPHGNPAGVVMMVAEKLAEQIMKDYNVTIPAGL